MTGRPRLVSLILALFAVSLLLSSGTENVVLPEVSGSWHGQARIIVSWCPQTNLFVRVNIDTNGDVTGKVGDATLINARIRRNRGWLGQKLNLKTDYLITGRLEGPIVAQGQIQRSNVFIPLNLAGKTLAGGLHTNGRNFGAAENRKVSAARLRLTRTDSME